LCITAKLELSIKDVRNQGVQIAKNAKKHGGVPLHKSEVNNAIRKLAVTSGCISYKHEFIS